MRIPTASWTSWRSVLRPAIGPAGPGDLDQQRLFAFQPDRVDLLADIGGDRVGDDHDADVRRGERRSAGPSAASSPLGDDLAVDSGQPESADRILVTDTVELHRSPPEAKLSVAGTPSETGLATLGEHRYAIRGVAITESSSRSTWPRQSRGRPDLRPSATNSRLRVSSSGCSAAAPSAAAPILPTA